MAAIAFFDLDRTLIACNSATLWLYEEITACNVSLSDALKACVLLVRYRLGSVAIADALSASMGAMKGRLEAEVVQRTQQFYARSVQPKFRPGGLQAVAKHRERGDKLVLLTSSSKYLSELVTRDLALDDYLCTLLEVDPHGRFTGEVSGRLCFGEGKLVAARTYASTVGVALSECAFYTDSAADLSVMEVVGQPIAVNPDVRLRRIAQARQWPVVDWGQPG